MRDTDKVLWDLLGKAPRPTAPPFFAAKVMRAVEAQKPRPWLAPVLRWLAPATVAALVVFSLVPRPQQTAAAEFASSGELTTLDIVELLSPDDYLVLTAAGWPYGDSSSQIRY